MPSAQPLTEEYLSAILEANERVNLTRITDHDQAALLHLEDSLVALPEMEIARPGVRRWLSWGTPCPCNRQGDALG